jgi:aminopeptidase N
MHRALMVSMLAVVSANGGHVPRDGPAPVAKRAAVACGLPRAPLPDTASVDLLHISLSLRVDWRARSLAGQADLVLLSCAPVDTIALDADGLVVSLVRSGSGETLSAHLDTTRADGALRVALHQRASPGDTVRLRIDYRTSRVNHADPSALGGSNGRGVRFISPTRTEPMKRRQLWTMGAPDGNRSWFPSIDQPHDLRTTDVRVTVESPLQVVSNGALMAREDRADGTRTFIWRAVVPHANHRTAIVIGEWTSVSTHAAGTPVETLSYPDEVEATRASVERLPEMLSFFRERLGVTPPWPMYRQVVVQDAPWGVGAAGLAILTENFVDDERTHAEYRWLWDGLQGEAAAMPWFGDVISPRTWRDVWLTRGLAQHMDGLFNEHRNGRAEYLLWHLVSGDHATYLADWAGGTRHPIVPTNDREARQFAEDNYPGARACAVLHLLREVMGDSAWWAGVRAFVRANAGGTITTAAFQHQMEQAHGSSLAWFFDQWVHGMGHPIFSVSTRHDAARRTMTVTLTQVQPADTASVYPQVRYFQGPMHLGIGARDVRVVVQPQRVNQFVIANVPRRPPFVRIDRGSAWLKEVQFAQPTAALVAQMRSDDDPTGRAQAITELGARLRSDSSTATERGRIVQSLHEFSATDAYWRWRLTALSQLTWWVRSVPPAERPARMDAAFRASLRRVVAQDSSWVRAQAVALLGDARDRADRARLWPLLRDRFHTVNWTTAIALGTIGGPGVLDTLAVLSREPSWKGENMLAALSGMAALRDPRAVAVALSAVADTSSRRWYLATPRWDTRLQGAATLTTLGRDAVAQAWPFVEPRLRSALDDGDVNDVFSTLLLMATLGDARAASAFAEVRERYGWVPGADTVISGMESQWARARDALAPR